MTYRSAPEQDLAVPSSGFGILIRFWRWLFGDPYRSRPCSATRAAWSNDRCPAMADPRCRGNNCTRHCNEHCDGACRGATS